MSVVTRFLAGLIPCLALLQSGAAGAVTFKTLHAFANGTDGAAPVDALVLDAAGALYGTTYEGGHRGVGTAFKFDPKTSAITVLHVFTDGSDGGNPRSGLAFDQKGMLYGTASHGGNSGCDGLGCGTVFKLDPATKKFTTLHVFTQGNDGAAPYGGLAVGPQGMLYGTTYYAGVSPSYGTLFRLNPTNKNLVVLHSFTYGEDGGTPRGDLLLGPGGILYGTTAMGGDTTGGVAFKLNLKSLVLTPLNEFSDENDPSSPYGGLVFGPAGLLYGASWDGGGPACDYFGCGTLYSLSPSTGALTVLHAFTAGATGKSLYGKVAFDAKGNLYGTTSAAGTSKVGTVYKFNPTTKALVTLHEFTNKTDGGTPEAGLVLGANGSFYGTTSTGGANGAGTLFEFTP